MLPQNSNRMHAIVVADRQEATQNVAFLRIGCVVVALANGADQLVTCCHGNLPRHDMLPLAAPTDNRLQEATAQHE